MTISLDRLPFDVSYNITESLGLEDIINFCYTCHLSNFLLDESTLCRKAVETHAPHSREAILARNGEITYGEAIKNIYSRRTAFSKAFPFSACVIGQGSAFTYRQGVLCVVDDHVIRVTDIHASKEPHEISICPAIGGASGLPAGSPSSEPKLTLLYYSDNALSILYERKGRPSSARIFVIDTTAGSDDRQRLIRDIPLESSQKIFARHTSAFLCYGTYTGRGDHSHHEWQIFVVPLSREQKRSWIKPLQLKDFFGTDVGSTIAFEIHNGYFYAVSNQTSFDVEEVDWTSFYHVVRFPLDNPITDAMEIDSKVYRRQHAEGPIHDSWLDLTIQVDEKTDQPMIVEARREWQKGSSRQLRTYYLSKIDFRASRSRSGSPGSADYSTAPLLPANDPYTHLIGSSDRPNYAPEQPRYSWQVHPEFGPRCEYTRSFILARTKFKGYNYSAGSFVDLVEDDRCCETTAGGCLRIRVGSRREGPKHKEVQNEGPSGEVDKSEDVEYRHSEIGIWPPRARRCACSARLHRIMNPDVGSGGYGRTITTVLDERSMVYMVKGSKGYGGESNETGTIVLLSFDPRIKPPAWQRTIDDTKSEADGGMLVDTENPRRAEDDLVWSWKPGRGRCRGGQCQ